MKPAEHPVFIVVSTGGCGMRSATRTAPARHRRCYTVESVRIPIVSPFVTGDTVLEMVRFLKFAGGRIAVPSLSWWMALSLSRHLSQAPRGAGSHVVLIAVPLHTARRRERGYNQAQLLAERVARSLSLVFEADVLERVRNTRRQASLPEGEREGNVRGAFQLIDLKSISGKHVVLVDDLVTTAETAKACVAALMDGDPDMVTVLSAGRAGALRLAGGNGQKTSYDRTRRNDAFEILSS